MANTSKEKRVDNILYINKPKKSFTKEELLAKYNDEIKFLCFGNSIKLYRKEEINAGGSK